jgi:GNAT superfamily N-acetyltransferase
MIELRVITKEDKQNYIQFLVDHFDNVSEEHVRTYADKEIDCMFSDYFRAPVFYAFYKDGVMIGTSGIIREWVAPATGSIFWVCTHKDYRGQGIGTHIMNDTIKNFAENIMMREPATIMLYCLEENCPFYESLGFDKGPKGHKWFFMSKLINVQ